MQRLEINSFNRNLKSNTKNYIGNENKGIQALFGENRIFRNFNPFIKSRVSRWISGMEIFVTICAPYFHVENRGFKIYWLVETNITNAISLDRGVNVLSNCNQADRSLKIVPFFTKSSHL